MTAAGDRRRDAPADLSTSIEQFGRCRVAVIGDVMLDEFVVGEVTRLSPEAPVPILEVRERRSVPGGAANAAANIAALGAQALLVGVVGSDVPGNTARRLAEEAGVDVTGILTDHARPTTTKSRVVAGNQQVVRIDHELAAPLSGPLGEALARRARHAIEGADAVVVSDYAKGVVTPALLAVILDAAGTLPVVVDPKQPDFAVYQGARVVTPNRGELELASGRSCRTTDDAIDAALDLLPSLGGAALLVTLGAAGMALLQPGTAPVPAPARSRPVFDVTGAGDTVVSALALALAVGLSVERSLGVVSAAAAVAVSKPGTSTVSIDELRAELLGDGG